MKKINFIALFACCTTVMLHAQPVKKGTNLVSIGLGVGSNLLVYDGSKQTPAISVQYERGLWKIPGPGVISLGGYFGYKGYKYTGGGSNQRWNYTVVGVRGAYHYNGFNSGSDNLSKLDVYAGVMVSADIVDYSHDGVVPAGAYGTDAGVSVFAGGRYFFTKNIAAMAEVGYGISFLTVGLTFKF